MRILVLLEHRENNRLLSEHLSTRYDVRSAENDRSSAAHMLQEEAFDLGIVDGPMLERLRSQIEQRRRAERSVFLPFLLVTSQRGLTLARQHLWQTVDELIFTPIERMELLARVEILLRARKTSLESEQRYFSLAANSPVGVAIVQEHRIVYANDLLLHLLDIRREDVGSCDFVEPFHPDDRPEVVGMRGEWLDPQSPSPLEARVNLRSGLRWVELRTASINYRGAMARLYVVSDITARKQVQRELERAKTEAEQLARLKSSLLDNLSHEIRTPLTSIIGFADIMGEMPVEDVAHFAGMVRASGERLLETLTSVLELSRLESGQFELIRQEVDLVEVVRETIRLFEPQIHHRGLDVVVRVASEAAVHVYTDRSALNRILSNLLSNAIKFTPEGTITLSVQAHEDSMEMGVSDEGVGISAEFLSQIFDEFKQESSGITRSFEGVGLGLTITKRLVELLGGEIRVESEKGRGSTFSVRLPRRHGHSSAGVPDGPSNVRSTPDGPRV